MTATAQRPVTVEDVDGEIGRGFRDLRFSGPVESLFLDEYLTNRARMVPWWALLGTLMYLLATMGDLSMMPDMASLMVGLRFGVFVPFAVMVVAVMRLWPSAFAYDLLSLGVGILGISLPMVAMVFSQGTHLFVYQTGSIATFGFFVIVLRPRFRTVLIGLAAMTAVQLVTTRLNGGFDQVTYSGIVSFYLTLGMFLAMSAWFTEHVDRQNFLNRLRGEILQEELKDLSESDPMTGLRNRHSLARMRNALWTRSSTGRIVSAIMLDIDNFKLYNDIHGHLRGDDCIRSVSAVARGLVGGNGSVFRYGGEEILVLLPDTDYRAAFALAEQIRTAIRDLAIPHEGLSQGGVVTASLGVATSRTDEHSMEELLMKADAALYEAKRSGRNKARGWLLAEVPLAIAKA